MAKAKKEEGKKGKGKAFGGKHIFLFCLIVFCIVFRATALLVCIGMLPTLVAFFISVGRYQARAYAVGALNFAGCTPFILRLWESGNDFEVTFDLLSKPMTIITIYGAATGGYLLNWSCVAFVSSLMYEKGKMRVRAIIKRKEDLVGRWGKEVTGTIPLDPEGFPQETSKAELRRKM